MFKQGSTISNPTVTDPNNITENGVYYIPTTTHMPYASSGQTLMHLNVQDGGSIAFQICFPRVEGKLYTRIKWTTWHNWYRFEGTEEVQQ